MIERSPRAPVFRFKALRAMAVKRIGADFQLNAVDGKQDAGTA